MPASLHNDIRRLLESVEKEMIDYTRGLIAINTVNPPGNNYLQCAEYIAKIMDKLGLNPKVIEVPKDRLQELAPHGEGLPRYSVLGELKGAEGGPVLHYSGHYDVVPAGVGWTVDPFTAEVRDDKIFGLGSGDQKAGIASMLAAAQVVQKLGVDLKGSVTFSFTPDEETGGQAGVGYLVNQGLVKAKWAVISEPSMPHLLKIGHRGALWLLLTTHGRTAHGSMAFKGINAFEKMAKITVALKELERKIQYRTTAYPTEFEEERHPMFMLGGVIKGGVNKTNVVPDECTISIDRRVLPEENLRDALDEIVDTLDELKARDPELSYSIKKQLEVEGIAISQDEQIAVSLADCHQLVFGQRPRMIISPGYNDLRYFVSAGIPTVTYGPGILARAHTPDEYVDIRDLRNTTAVFAELICELLGCWG